MRVFSMKTFLVILAVFVFQTAIAEVTISASDIDDKARGMWLGQLIGNAAGRPTEGDYQMSPNPDPNVPWVIKEIWDADDDTDIEYIAMHILETHGFDCNSLEISEQWREHITLSGIYIGNRQAWFLMGDGFLPPDTGSRTYNEHWYSIDSQITTEVLGAVSPGMVQQAIDLTGRFAHISNEGFPVHASQFYAAMYANAFFESDVLTLVTEALNTIPATSRTHKVISDVLAWYLSDADDGTLDWRATRQLLRDHYEGADSYGRYYNWLESTINTGATVLAILYGQGDFKQTVQISVLAGWDNDCNPATAGGLIGIIDGFSGLPGDLTDPAVCGDVYKNVYRPYLPDHELYSPQYETITNIASRVVALAEQNILQNGGYMTSAGPTAVYHIPDQGSIITEPEKYDPDGPMGLVADAIVAGLTVTPTAAVARFNSGYDRHDLYSIIDGITDNSYNGHRPYYSYISGGLDQDWYQLNFSQPVKFDGAVFYEGDVVWGGINNYYRDDEARGGFFNDLTVQVLRDGRFITPANLEMTPLDRYQMYQPITFDFAPTVGDAIRIIGSPGGTYRYTTIMELQVEGDVDPGLYVRSIKIAEGQTQRSSIKKIEVEFSDDVMIYPDAIELVGDSNGTAIDPANINFVYDNLSYKLTLEFDFDNDGNFADSLPDDIYQLKLNCSAISDSIGHDLLDDDSDPADEYYTVEFHRLYGDADGSGIVDLSDIAALASVWLGEPASTGLDADGDGQINMLDLRSFSGYWLGNILD